MQPAWKEGPERRNQSGLTLGGPIVNNRTFFFADYQRTDSSKAGGANGTVPTAQMKQGIFTGARDLEIDRNADGEPFYPQIAPCVDEVNDVLNLTARRTDGLPCGDPTRHGPGRSLSGSQRRRVRLPVGARRAAGSDSFDVRIDHEYLGQGRLLRFLQLSTDRHRRRAGSVPQSAGHGGASRPTATPAGN